MANRFPLIVDVDDGNKLKELPTGDNLNLDNAGIVNLSSLSVSGSLNGGSLSSSATLAVTTNATIGGTLSVTGTSTLTGNVTASGDVAVTGDVSAATITLAGAPLLLPVQSDWTESNTSSLAFIKNKPTTFAPDNLDDIGDVFVSGATVGQVLTYDGASWQAQAAAGGISLADLSVIQNPASGSGSLVYNNGTGVFEFTPGAIPTAVSQLTNDSGYTTLAAVSAVGYLQTGDILSEGRITTSVALGQVTIGFSDTGLLTTVAVSGNITGDGTGGNPIVLADTISLGVVNATDTGTASTFKDITADNITASLSLSSTNGNFTTTNGNITATNGTVTGNNVVASNELQTGTIINAGNTITLNGSKVQIQNNHFGLGYSGTLPTPAAIGDIAHTGGGVQAYVDDIDGVGTPGWIGLGGAITTRGVQLSVWTGGARPASPRIGEMIWDDDVPNLKVWDGAAWLNIGP
jgi:cytoskeletal protein CcmA (bactofilin family)